MHLTACQLTSRYKSNIDTLSFPRWKFLVAPIVYECSGRFPYSIIERNSCSNAKLWPKDAEIDMSPVSQQSSSTPSSIAINGLLNLDKKYFLFRVVIILYG